MDDVLVLVFLLLQASPMNPHSSNRRLVLPPRSPRSRMRKPAPQPNMSIIFKCQYSVHGCLQLSATQASMRLLFLFTQNKQHTFCLTKTFSFVRSSRTSCTHNPPLISINSAPRSKTFLGNTNVFLANTSRVPQLEKTFSLKFVASLNLSWSLFGLRKVPSGKRYCVVVGVCIEKCL